MCVFALNKTSENVNKEDVPKVLKQKPQYSLFCEIKIQNSALSSQGSNFQLQENGRSNFVKDTSIFDVEISML